MEKQAYIRIYKKNHGSVKLNRPAKKEKQTIDFELSMNNRKEAPLHFLLLWSARAQGKP